MDIHIILGVSMNNCIFQNVARLHYDIGKSGGKMLAYTIASEPICLRIDLVLDVEITIYDGVTNKLLV